MIGEQVWGRGLDLPGLGGGLRVEVSWFSYIYTLYKIHDYIYNIYIIIYNIHMKIYIQYIYILYIIIYIIYTL